MLMKRLLILATAMLCCLQGNGQTAGTQKDIMTPWGENLEQNRDEIPWTEYPRPQMVRENWTNLNGIWEYAITPKEAGMPERPDGEIRVPFAIESRLSGVQKNITDQEELWYFKTLQVPKNKKGENTLLHFGAVDWRSTVYVNGTEVGTHEGGFTPFSFNITPYLKYDGTDRLTVRVWDPTDLGYQPIGKQKMQPEGIWYTPVTGIWQTVWLETVPETHICEIKSLSDIDRSQLHVTVLSSDRETPLTAKITLKDTTGQVIATGTGETGKETVVAVTDPILWDTENPYLYDMQVELFDGKKKIDEVKSYTAFRKISMQKDANGLYRMYLNNKPLFHLGTLDQGWWPDGLYTAPSDEALRYDIEKTKAWGFNMIRKHIKVEPARWYYHCDKAGMLVWQDMPSGEIHTANRSEWKPQNMNDGRDASRTAQSKENYYQEWRDIIDMLYSSPSVVVWVPFNEAWGQFDTEQAADWTKKYDSSRLVNSASGGNHRNCGDILDLHAYPAPSMFLFDPERVNVMGEYGGIGFPVKGHLWKDDGNWGYISFKNGDEVTREYIKYAEILIDLIKKGFAGSVYTQTTDVEGEVNGIMTYDRKIVKMNEQMLKDINKKIIETLTDQ